MSNNNLTDRAFWAKYWESKVDLVTTVSQKYPFDKVLERINAEGNIKTAIELGGFPGYYAIYLKKYFGISPTLLDYFIHRELLEKLLAYNHLSATDVKIIETDLFEYHTTEQFDFVLSVGLIEHFEDTENIIRQHISFLKPGAKLLITIPNFRGVNGWVQRTFDRYNYDKHNIACMDPKLLKNIAEKLGLKAVETYHYGKFSVWLENRKEKSFLTKAFVKLIWIAGKVLTRIVPVESRLFSPYIVLEASQ